MRQSDISLLDGYLSGLAVPASGINPKEGQLAVVAGTFSSFRVGEWQLEGSATSLFDFTYHRFWALSTGARQSIMYPVQSYVDAYVDAGSAWAADPDFYGFTRHETGEQYFKVPEDGRYRLELRGSSTKSKNNALAANGAHIVLELSLLKGELLRFIVGHSHGWGGAGATTVWSDTRGLLAIAAGAGGCYTDTPSVLSAAAAKTTCKRSDDDTGYAGSSQTSVFISGVPSRYYASGGAGWTTDVASTVQFKGAAKLKDMTHLGEGGAYNASSGAVIPPIGEGSIGGGGGNPQSGTVGRFAFGGGSGYSGGAAAAPQSSSVDMPQIAAAGGTNFATSEVGDPELISVTLRTTVDSVANPNGDLRITRLD